MIKTKRHLQTFVGGVDQDSAVTKYQNVKYFDAVNMRVISDDPSISGSMTNVKGNVLRLTFAIGDELNGFCKIRAKKNIDSKKDSIVFFTVNANSYRDKIYLFEGDPYMVDTNVIMNLPLADYTYAGYDYRAGYIYRSDDLNFDLEYPIKAEGRYESDDIRKVYWVDGKNNIRYMILDSVSLTDDPSIFDINPVVDMPAPVTSLISGGAYLAGKVQHSYQLYRKNGAATTFAPLSNALDLTAYDGGPNSDNVRGSILAENTGKAVQVEMTNLDLDFNRVRVVALHYQEYLVNPTVRIVGEYEYLAGEITVIDNGLTSLGTIPLEEFRLFGQTNYIANYLATKNNYLFFADIIEDRWTPDWLQPLDDQGDPNPDFFDCRAVRFANEVVTPSPQTMTSGVGSLDDNYNCTITYAAPDRITIVIPNAAALLGVPGTITDITDVTSPLVSGNFMEYQYEDINNNTINGSVSWDNWEHGALMGAVFADTITFDIETISGDMFTDFLSMYYFVIHQVVFTIQYTSSATLNIAKLNDTSLYEVNITAPADPDVFADWYLPACGWDKYLYQHNGENEYNSILYDNVPGHGFKYQADLATIGADGPNVRVDIDIEQFEASNPFTGPNVRSYYPYADTQLSTDHVSSARTEVYRIFIVFLNKKMQYSAPQWVCDFRMPTNDEVVTAEMEAVTLRVLANYIYPKVWLRRFPVDPDLYGWQVFRCERGTNDRSVMASGVVSQLAYNSTLDWVYPESGLTGIPGLCNSDNCFVKADDYDNVNATKDIVEIISPEIAFNKNLKFRTGDYLRIDGRYGNDNAFEVEVDQPAGADFSRRVTLIFKSTAPRTNNLAVEEVLYSITEGFFLAPSQTTGAPSAPDYPPRVIINGQNYEHIYYLYEMGGPTTIQGDRGYTFVAVNGNVDLMIDKTNVGWLYGSYLRNVYFTQYGGISYEARSYNQVIPYSPIAVVGSAEEDNAICYYGDTYITMFTYLRSSWPYMRPREATFISAEEVVSFPVESSINCWMRLDNIGKYYQPLSDDESDSVILQNTIEQGLKLQPDTYPLELGDLYRYNSVYSKSPNALTIQCVPFDSNVDEHNDVKVIASGKKINGEYHDQWTNIYINNFLTVDSKYGPIRNIFNFENRLFAGQNKGIAVLAVNDRAILTDSNNLQLTLGSGDVLERFDYLTVTSGFQDYFDMVLSDKGCYYLDRVNKIFNSLSLENADVPISEINGYRSFLKSYGTINTVRTGFDPYYKDVFFYISDGVKENTSVYGELVGSFTGRHTFYPDRIFNLNDRPYSSTGNTVYIHNEGNYGDFYGVPNDSSITMLLNPEKINECRFDILDLRVDILDTDNITPLRTIQFDEMEISNNYQSTAKLITFSGDDSSEDTSKVVIGNWRTWLLPDDQSDDFYRFVDTFAKIKLTKYNDPNYRLVLHDATLYYRPTKN